MLTKSSSSTPKREMKKEYIRTFGVGEKEQREYLRLAGEVYPPGAALGRDADGVHPFAPGMEFAGFVIGTTDKHVVAVTRGMVNLKIEGATSADRKKPVYCLGANEFSLSETKGASPMGLFFYLEPKPAWVTTAPLSTIKFKRHDDTKPLDLNLNAS
jgi:hypothetical protein